MRGIGGLVNRDRVLLAAAVVGTALLVVPLPGAEPGLQSALKLTVLAGVAAAISVRRCWRREPWPQQTAVEWWLLAFVASALLSTLVGQQSWVTSAPIVIAIVCLWIVTRSAHGAVDSTETAIAIACAGIAACAGLELLGADLPWSWIRRPESTLGNRNHVAEYLAVALPLLVTRATRGRRAAIVLVVVVVAVIVATRCRTAYLAGFAAGFVAMTSHGWRVFQRRMVLAVVAGGLLGLAPWPGVAFHSSAGDSLARVFTVEGSGEARIRQHERGITALASPVRAGLGFGAGSWMTTSAAYAHADGGHAPRFSAAAVPNSEWLRTAVEQGVVGLVLLIGVFVAALRGARRDPDRRRRASMLATLGAIAVCGTFDPLIARPEMVALIAVVLGGGAGAGRTPRQGGVFAARCAAAACVVAVATASLRCVSFAASAAGADTWAMRLWPRPALAEQRALQLAGRGACTDAEHALSVFTTERPHHWGARVAVARCYAKSDDSIAARRIWRAAILIEPHLRALVDTNQERP